MISLANTKAIEKMPATTAAAMPKEDAVGRDSFGTSTNTTSAQAPAPSKPPVAGDCDTEARLREQIWIGLSKNNK